MTDSSAPSPAGLNRTAYDRAFFERIEAGSLASAGVVVPIVIGLLNPKSVMDVGCGRGAWLRTFHENGVPIIRGMDGSYINPAELMIPAECFSAVDLGKPFQIQGKYDLAVCLEVGEHLPVQSAKGLVANLTGSAPAVLFSAALPGQGGIHHVNEQWPSYWRDLFRSFGYHRTDPVRRRVLTDTRVEPYYRQNIFLFASENAIAASETLQAERRHADESVMEYIGSDTLGRYMSLRGLLHQLPGAALRATRRIFRK